MIAGITYICSKNSELPMINTTMFKVEIEHNGDEADGSYLAFPVIKVFCTYCNEWETHIFV